MEDSSLPPPPTLNTGCSEMWKLPYNHGVERIRPEVQAKDGKVKRWDVELLHLTRIAHVWTSYM